MFDSLEDLSVKLAATGYFIDSVMTQVVFLAATLQKPLLLEGPAGSGKAQVFGWVGSFILGIGFYSLTKMQSTSVSGAQGWAAWSLWTAGVALRVARAE